MRIVIDMQGAQTGSRFRGIGRYTLSLAKAIIKNKGNHEIILFLSNLNSEVINSITATFSKLINTKNIKICNLPGPVYEMDTNNLWRQKAAEKIREDFLFNLHPDFVLITTLFEGFGENFVCSINQLHKIPTAVIFYDLIPLMNEEVYLADKNVSKWYKNKVFQCEQAQLLLSISKSSREEAIKYLNFSPKQIINISTASDGIFGIVKYTEKEEEKIRKKFKLFKHYLMYSGATDDRKNHLRLIEAFSLLPQKIRRNHQLAVVGGMPDDHKDKFLKHAKNHGLSNNEFILTGKVTDDEMNLLYNMCRAFIFPSWHEGFGLPALEAMQCGKAVIASNTSSLPEVIGNEKALFNPFNIQDITNKINNVLSDKNFRNLLEKHSINQAKKFSWDITSKRAISAMEKYHNKPKSNIDINKLIKSIGSIDTSYNESDLRLVSECIFKNNRKRHLFVDISELVQNDHNTGIQRVTKNILIHLLTSGIDKLSIIPVYATVNKSYCYANTFVNNKFNLNIEDIKDSPIDFFENDIFLCLDMSPPINIKNKKFYKQIKNNGVSVYFVVHDILPVLHPYWWDAGVSENFQEWLNIVIESTGAICVSKQTADDLYNWIKKNKAIQLEKFKIKISYNGVENSNNISNTKLMKNYNEVLNKIKNKISFVIVGTLEPRKGHNEILKAFEKLWKDDLDINLIIVGKKGWLVNELIEKLQIHLELNHHLFWLNGISDEYLNEIYSFSNCLIAASEAEGFGLPLIEAAQRKLPIIARDIPIFREIAGDYAYYFNNDLDVSIKKWIDLYKLNKHPKSNNMSYLTWEESATNLLDCLEINQN